MWHVEVSCKDNGDRLMLYGSLWSLYVCTRVITKLIISIHSSNIQILYQPMYAGKQRGPWTVEGSYRKGWLHWKGTSSLLYLLTIQPCVLLIQLILWQVVIGMDVAASEFFSDKDKTYDLNFKEDVRTATYYAFIYSELVFMLLYRPMIINDYLY